MGFSDATAGNAAASAAATSLEIATKLAHGTPGWYLNLFVDAGEAAGTFRGSFGPREWVAPGEARDPERARVEAGRRARTSVRRYVVANRLYVFGTLTFGGDRCRDPAHLRRELRRFWRQLRRVRGGDLGPYVWVPELHSDGEHFHAHFATDRYLPHAQVAAAWGRGFAHLKAIGSHRTRASLRECRRTAGYLSKYMTKTFEGDAGRPLGLHRYDKAEGYAPRYVKLWGPSAEVVVERAADLMGRAPSSIWRSFEIADWQGPSAVWAGWDD